MIIKTRNGFRGRTIERVRHEAFSYRAWSYISSMPNVPPSLETVINDTSGSEYRIAMTKNDIEMLIEAYNAFNKLEGM